MNDENESTPGRSLHRSPSVEQQQTTGEAAFDDMGTPQTPSPFFADAMLDLSEALDIAETPEAVMRRIVVPVIDADDNDKQQYATSSSAPGLEVPTLERRPAEKTSFQRISGGSVNMANAGRPGTLPRWPRDVFWAASFWLFVPISLIWPIVLLRQQQQQQSTNDEQIDPSALSLPPLSRATIHALVWAAVATFILSRLLYRTAGGGDGDDARHVACQVLTVAAPLSMGVCALLAYFLWHACPTMRWTVLVPLWYTLRDLYLLRQWKRRSEQAGGTTTRQAFFSALTCAALDILSRSLRRASFYRVLTLLLVVQFVVLLWWRWAIVAALSATSTGSDIAWNHKKWLILAMAIIGGKWATGTVARMLSLIACGGVTSWFLQQSELLNALEAQQQRLGDFQNNPNPELASPIPEAYRTVDASVYQSVLDLDDALDDDFEPDYEEDELLEDGPRRREDRLRQQRARMVHDETGGGVGIINSTNPGTYSTVKSILFAGLTISFGSVALCGLLGGAAQFLLSQMRKVEAAQAAISQARINAAGRRHVNSDNGFRGMQVGRNNNGDISFVARVGRRINLMTRGFIRRFSDLAMTHVAGYYKSYQKAALDVAVLIDESGVEPILHDDITTHMCSSVGGAISGLVVLITSYLTLWEADEVTDWELAANILLSFILSYTLIFTVMEPLRAAIKAVYVSFAQHPRSLSQAFPLIFHRLSRLSQSNVT